jgi:hypothetical protein
MGAKRRGRALSERWLDVEVVAIIGSEACVSSAVGMRSNR